MLVAFALRFAAARAIRAAVWPEFTIAESPEKPLELLASGQPLIALYTGTTTDGLDGNELLGGDTRVALTVQVFLPSEFTIATATGGTLTFDTRKQGADTVLDVLARRILAALVAQAEPWSDLYGQMVTRTTRVANHSYLIEEGEVRCAARELTLDLETLNEPVPGAPPDGVWADFVALMRGDDALAPLADWFAAEIEGAPLPPEERDRIDLGLSAYAAAAVSILPIVRGSEIGEVAVTVDGADGERVVVPGPAVDFGTVP